MAGRPSKFTPDARHRILQFTRAGSYRQVAARAAGISVSTLNRWLFEGERQVRGKYREFYDAMMQAEAEARAAAEIRVLQTNPLAWLRMGPGQWRGSVPGWGPVHQPTQRQIRRAAREVAVEQGIPLAAVNAMMARAERIAERALAEAGEFDELA